MQRSIREYYFFKDTYFTRWQNEIIKRMYNKKLPRHVQPIHKIRKIFGYMQAILQ